MKNTLRALLASALLLLRLRGHRAGADASRCSSSTGRRDATTTAGVNAIKDARHGRRTSASTRPRRRPTSTRPTSRSYRALVFLNTAGDLLNAEQESAVQRFVEQRQRLPRHRLAPPRASPARFFDGLIGARPTAGSPTAHDAADSSSPVTACTPRRATCRCSGRARTSGTSGPTRVDRHGARRRPLPRRRTRAAGDGTKTTADTDTPISWCRDYRGGRSFYTGMGRTAAAYGEADFKKHLLGALQWTAGLTRGNCKATINSQLQGHAGHERRRRESTGLDDQPASRTASRSPTTAGCSTSAAATAAPTPSAARS